MDTLKLIQILLEKANLEEKMRHIENRMHPIWLEQPANQATEFSLYAEAIKENQRLQIEMRQQRAEALRMHDEMSQREAKEKATHFAAEEELRQTNCQLRKEHEALVIELAQERQQYVNRPLADAYQTVASLIIERDSLQQMVRDQEQRLKNITINPQRYRVFSDAKSGGLIHHSIRRVEHEADLTTLHII
jgi:Ran GTPase-activating protein (RanGAP) involved in mRNA processing and transport